VDAFDILWQQLPLGVLYLGVNAYLRYFLLAFIVYALSVDDADMEAVLKVLAPVFVGLSLLTIVQFATGHAEQFFLNPSVPPPMRGGIRQGVGIFDWPDGWALFCGTWFFIYFARRTRSSLYLVTSILLALAVGATLTRWCIAALLALLVLYLLKQRRARWRAAALVVIIAALAVLYGGQIKSQFFDLRFYSAGEAPRVAYLREGIRVFFTKPLYTLTGVGYYRFGRAVPYAIDDPRTNPINGLVTALTTTDSIIASLLPEFGVVGLLLLLGFFIVVLRQGTHWAKNNPAARGYVYSMVFVLLSSLSASEGFFGAYAAVFWVAAGLVLVASRRESRVSAAPSPRRWS
jgi:O-antigen ligase